eukprot:TRINITY_DN24026_c0_g1_i1.p1 TRINITY_DN24026_c0_g1~~TRINITY_DN24026_c0_g1_i1.p1  ORF type:complete len:276 (-),score=9.28 TRINITY_DN24026_c0_g1_i1:20-847(-)
MPDFEKLWEVVLDFAIQAVVGHSRGLFRLFCAGNLPDVAQIGDEKFCEYMQTLCQRYFRGFALENDDFYQSFIDDSAAALDNRIPCMFMNIVQSFVEYAEAVVVECTEWDLSSLDATTDEIRTHALATFMANKEKFREQVEDAVERCGNCRETNDSFAKWENNTSLRWKAYLSDEIGLICRVAPDGLATYHVVMSPDVEMDEIIAALSAALAGPPRLDYKTPSEKVLKRLRKSAKSDPSVIKAVYVADDTPEFESENGPVKILVTDLTDIPGFMG